MTKSPRLASICLALIMTFTMAAHSAMAADLPVDPEADFVSEDVCAQPGYLSTIAKRFQRYDPAYYQTGLSIVHFGHARTTRYEPETETFLIPRLYCQVPAVMSDGRERTVFYLIEYGVGFSSIGDNLEFCISGLDRWHVYGSHCHSVR